MLIIYNYFVQGCSFQGKIYTNGESWHPRVLPFGVMNCVTCECKVSAQ